jgi:hypothetical protein
MITAALRRHAKVTAIFAAGFTGGALALGTPVVAQSLFDARNAHRVDGLHAKQLAKVQYFQASQTFDNFDTCTYSTLMSRTFKIRHSGVVSVQGSVGASRDTGNPSEGLLTTRILIDGEIASLPSSVNLENDGTEDGASATIGARSVKSGSHTLEIQGKECGAGMAFISTQSMLASYSPFGAAGLPPNFRHLTGAHANR